MKGFLYFIYLIVMGYILVVPFVLVAMVAVGLANLMAGAMTADLEQIKNTPKIMAKVWYTTAN